MKFHNLWKITDKNGAKPGGTYDDWLIGYDAGRASTFKDIWNDLHDRYFQICKDRNRLDEFNALRELREKEEA